MVSPDGSIHTTHTPPPLSFYNTFNDDNSSMDSLFFDTSLLFPNPLWVGISPLWVGIEYYTRLWKKKTKSSEMTKLYGATTKHLYIKENSVTAKIIIDDDITR